MKVRSGVLLGAIAALGVATVADAAPSPYKITGGGQTFVEYNSEEGVKGPGNTITFQAFMDGTGTQDDSSGHVNIIDRRESETGKGEHFRGTVTCTVLMPDPAGGGYAELYGTGTKGDSEDRNFVVRILDNGQGTAESDLVDFELDVPDSNCEEQEREDGEEPEMTLARGNAKIHKQNSGASQSSSAKSKSTSTTTQSTSLTSALTLR